MSAGPLAGITVLDLTQIYNGPYATFLMAMAGAEVIKIEPPGGEQLRRRHGDGGATLPFAMLNSGKSCVVLDLKAEEDRAALLRMAAGADVLVENYRPGVMDRLGLSREVLRGVNPRLICASGSGYGGSGPYRDYPAMDLVVQAMSGVMSITGEAGGPPLKAGPALCDFFAGIHLYGAIVTALLDRERGGPARAVEVAMLEAVYPSLTSNLALLSEKGSAFPGRTGNRHGGLSVCPYNVYPAADGHVAIICNHDGHWRAAARYFGHAELIDDPRFLRMTDRVANMDLLDGMVASWTAAMPKEEIFRGLAAAGVPCAPVREPAEVVADAHLHERRALLDIEHPQFGPMTVPTSALCFEGIERGLRWPSRPLGADQRLVPRPAGGESP